MSTNDDEDAKKSDDAKKSNLSRIGKGHEIKRSQSILDMVLLERWTDTSKDLLQKSLSSCMIACLGELIARYFKLRRLNQPYTVDIRRLMVFGLHGLVLTGPLFSWWCVFSNNYEIYICFILFSGTQNWKRSLAT